MSPERATILYIEDDETVRESRAAFLEMVGHKIVLEAGNLEDAEKSIDLIGKYGVDVVLLDANLSKKDTSGKDGVYLLSKIREAHPGTKIIGISLGQDIQGVDANCHKREGLEKLNEAISNI